MKKTWLMGLAMCAVMSLAAIGPVFACIDENGNVLEGTDCAAWSETEGDAQNETTESEVLAISADTIDYGYLSELGRTYTQTFTVENKSTETHAIKVSAEKPNMDKISDEAKLAASWLAFVGGVRYFEIPAGGSKLVSMRVTVPADAKCGSQYATIKIEDTTTNEIKELSVRMTVATDGLAYGGEVIKNYARPIDLSDKVHAGVTIKNGGNAGFVATYSVRVSPRFGLQDWQDIVNEEMQEVYPGAEIEFAVDDDDATIGYGIFTVEQRIVYVNSDGSQVEEVSTRTVLNAPIWLVTTIGGVLVVLILVMVILNIIKKKKAEDAEQPRTVSPKKRAKEGGAEQSRAAATKKTKKKIEIQM